MSNFVSEATARMTAVLTFVSSENKDEVVKTITVSEGDIVRDLVYGFGDNRKTVSGVVRKINYTTRSVRPDFKNVFAQNNNIVVNSIVLDASDTYCSSIVPIPISHIQDIGEVENNSIDITDIEVIGNTLTFISSAEPITILWNNQTEEFKINDDGKYEVELNTMCKENRLYIIGETGYYSNIVEGIAPVVERDDCIKTAMDLANERLIDYYNKTSDSLDFDDLYTIVASNVGNTRTITLNGIEFDILDFMRFKVSTADVVCEVFKIENHDLKIFVPALDLYSSANIASVEVSGFKFNCPSRNANSPCSYDPHIEGSTEGAENEIYLRGTKIIHTRQDKTSYVGMTYKANGIKINDDVYAYAMIKHEDRPETYSFGKLANYTAFSSFDNMGNGLITDETAIKNTESTYRICMVGYGAVKFSIDTIESVAE